MEQQAPAVRSSYRLDAGVFVLALIFLLFTQWFFYWAEHFPIEDLSSVGTSAQVVYFGLCGVLIIWVLARFIQRRIRTSLFLVAAALILITALETFPYGYPYFSDLFDQLRFRKNQEFYRKTVASTDPSTVHIFKWSGENAVGEETYSYLVFDNNRMERPGEQLGDLSAAVTHPEPIGGVIDVSRLSNSACSTYYFRLAEGFLIVRATCNE